MTNCRYEGVQFKFIRSLHRKLHRNATCFCETLDRDGTEARRDFPEDYYAIVKASVSPSTHRSVSRSLIRFTTVDFTMSGERVSERASEYARAFVRSRTERGDKIRRPVRGDCLSRHVLRTRLPLIAVIISKSSYQDKYRTIVAGMLGLLALETTWPRRRCLRDGFAVHVIAGDRNYR